MQLAWAQPCSCPGVLSLPRKEAGRFCRFSNLASARANLHSAWAVACVGGVGVGSGGDKVGKGVGWGRPRVALVLCPRDVNMSYQLRLHMRGYTTTYILPECIDAVQHDCVCYVSTSIGMLWSCAYMHGARRVCVYASWVA